MWPNKPSSLLTLAALLVAAGCSSPEPETAAEVTATPPSIAAENEGSVVVRLTDAQASELKIQTFVVKEDSIRFSVTAPGTVFPAPENISIISAPVSGRISQIFAHEGERVSKGAPLLELESLEYANLLGDFLENQAEMKYLGQQLERDRQLVEKEITPQRTLDRTEADYARAVTKVQASKARLSALGITERQFTEWENHNSEPQAHLIMYAPISGNVNEHLIDLGTSVSTHQKMLDLINPSHVLIRGYVPPEDAAFIKEGTPVTIATRNAESGVSDFRKIETVVATVNPSLDAANRAIPVNILTETVQGWPVIGQNIRAHFSILTSDAGFVIPLSAVQFEQDGAAVFVEVEPNVFEKRAIFTGRMSDNDVIVTAGLNEGEKIAISQVFSLKALAKFEEFAD